MLGLDCVRFCAMTSKRILHCHDCKILTSKRISHCHDCRILTTRGFRNSHCHAGSFEDKKDLRKP